MHKMSNPVIRQNNENIINLSFAKFSQRVVKVIARMNFCFEM